MHILRFLDSFSPTYKAIIKGDQEKRTKKALNLLRQEPFYPSLKTHRVNTRTFGKRWSSWITGDIRIIWDFDQKENMIIILFAIVSYSGTHREYK